MERRIKALSRLSINNPLVGSSAVVPLEARIDEDQIHWKREPLDDWRWPLNGFREGGQVEGALWEFVQLGDADAATIERFARRYGVLALRKDGLPYTAPASGRHDPGDVEHDTGPDGGLWHSEPLAAWRMYADGLRAVLAFGRELRDNGYVDFGRVFRKYNLRRIDDFSFYGLQAMVDEDHVTPLHGRWTRSGPNGLVWHLSMADSADARRELFAWFVTEEWIVPSGLVPTLNWATASEPMRIDLGTTNIYSTVPPNALYRVLISQLVSVLTSDPFEKLDVCSVCGRMFIPAIRPGRHMRSFCEDHKIEGERERKRRWARKQAAKKRTQASG